MDDPESRICSNCKRDIPAVNFTIHSVHCARNIRVCPVCKEPVPVAELQDHHDRMHKLLPCKKCGEQVCGSDLEDHVRDSCALTIQTCKFCELELPRGELPAHEAYCGVRTEQCPDCREWVMLKYRQLHLDSNHGFLRLSDDPPPPKKEVAKVSRIPKTSNIPTASTSGLSTSRASGSSNQFNEVTDKPSTSNGNGLTVRFKDINTEVKQEDPDSDNDEAKLIWRQRASLETGAKNGQKLPKRTNDQPQINTNTTDNPKSSIKKFFKKRPAPAPPRPSPSPKRDLPYYSALQRQQDEERRRREQTAYNLARGLPPVLNPAEKLEKLRKMDRLQNPDAGDDRRARPAPPAPGPSRAPRPNRNVLISPPSPEDTIWNREELRNLKPMTTEQFAQRFNALRLASDSRDGGASGNCSGANGNGSGANGNGSGANGNDRRANGNDREMRAYADRFSEIKSSLRELRRGLNEVTAPYNSNAMANEPAINRHRPGGSSRRRDRGGGEGGATGGEDVQLPCEFCGQLQPLHDLVQHQTGCRPELAQLRPRRQLPALPAPEPLLSPVPHHDPHDLPFIPCEFCTESLPVYLINEHQERCRRDADPLYLD